MPVQLGRWFSQSSARLEFEPRDAWEKGWREGVLMQSQLSGVGRQILGLVSQPSLMYEFQANETACLKTQGEWYPRCDFRSPLHMQEMYQRMESSDALPRYLDEDGGQNDLLRNCDSAAALTWLGATSMGIFWIIQVTDSARGGVVREPG